jgi:UDP-N-acetylglucosamine diphosphorylase/glucosamine-1-phosphate N-acetyltransferase
MPQNIILWDHTSHKALLPFTFTRPVGLIRCGILTIAEKYQKLFSAEVSFLTQKYLQEKFKCIVSEEQNLVINATILPDENFISACRNLALGEALVQNEVFLAGNFSADDVKHICDNEKMPQAKTTEYTQSISTVSHIWDIFSKNDQEIKKDFALITKGRKSQPIPEGNFVKNPENIFLEEGAKVENASLNATDGPIYLAKDAEIMEGSLVRGPFSLGEHSTLKLGAKIYGATTIGPHCKVGGEVNNSVFFGYANKAHDGFVGNAVIGEWCNLGADSNNSNLKNNYEEVKVWSYEKNGFARTGLQFCGLFMGDHSKCGINTMFNTGTVVGVSANIFGGGFPRNFIPSFSWGGSSGFTTYQMNKALDTAQKVFERRKINLEEEDIKILNHIFEETKQHRNF